MTEIPNEALAIIENMAMDIINLRKSNDYSIVRMKEMAEDCKTLEAKVAAKKATIDAHLKTIELFGEERKKYCEEIAKIEAERDSARHKLGALCRVVNCLCGWKKERKPRVFLKEFEKAVADCIKKNDIRFCDGGMAK